MITVGAFDAKTHLSRLLKEVANGEQVTITVHGVPVAKLVSANERTTADRRATIASLRELSNTVSLGGAKVSDLIRQGRKY